MAGRSGEKKLVHGTSRRKKGAHRAMSLNPQGYKWLGAGTLTLGIGTALASGLGVAHANTSQSDISHSAGTATARAVSDASSTRVIRSGNMRPGKSAGA